MNRLTGCATFVATLGAMLALASTSAVAGKPGGGTFDPCTTVVDFPAFVYTQLSGRTWTIYVADSTGKCSRAVATTLATPVPKFSYPVGCLDRHRTSGVEVQFDDDY